jgi:hypothetical protein
MAASSEWRIASSRGERWFALSISVRPLVGTIRDADGYRVGYFEPDGTVRDIGCQPVRLPAVGAGERQGGGCVGKHCH